MDKPIKPETMGDLKLSIPAPVCECCGQVIESRDHATNRMIELLHAAWDSRGFVEVSQPNRRMVGFIRSLGRVYPPATGYVEVRGTPGRATVRIVATKDNEITRVEKLLEQEAAPR